MTMTKFNRDAEITAIRNASITRLAPGPDKFGGFRPRSKDRRVELWLIERGIMTPRDEGFWEWIEEDPRRREPSVW